MVLSWENMAPFQSVTQAVALPLHMVDSGSDHSVGSELKMLYVGGDGGA